VPAATKRGDRLVMERKFPARQQTQCIEAVERALRFRIEAAQGHDLLVEQFDAHRGIEPHRKQIDDRAAYREFAVLEHGIRDAVTGPVEGRAQPRDRQVLARLQRQRSRAHESKRRDPLHQGRDRYDQYRGLRIGKPRQCQQAVRDQVLVR